MEEIKPRGNKLTKRPPAGSDHQSQGSYSSSLFRAPSAPAPSGSPYSYRPSQGHSRQNTSPNPAAYASNSSFEHRISGSSSAVSGSDSNRSSTTRPLSQKTSEELIGAPFDGTFLLNHIDSTKATGYQSSLRRPPPPPLSHSAPRLMSPGLRQSASFSAGDRMNEKMTPRVGENQLISPKRFSDESKEPKSGMIRKKSGFSSLMTRIGLEKQGVKISAPENPVHVTHVGYDQDTGQFTVSFITAYSFCLNSSLIDVGPSERMAAHAER